MKLCNAQRDILYYSYIIGNIVGKAPTQEGGGGCRTAIPFQIEIKKHKFNRLEDVKRLTWFTLEPQSAIDIGWWLIQWNFEN